MIGSNRTIRVWAYPKPCDLRKGHNGLSGLVSQEFDAELLSGMRRGALSNYLPWVAAECTESFTAEMR